MPPTYWCECQMNLGRIHLHPPQCPHIWILSVTLLQVIYPLQNQDNDPKLVAFLVPEWHHPWNSIAWLYRMFHIVVSLHTSRALLVSLAGQCFSILVSPTLAIYITESATGLHVKQPGIYLDILPQVNIFNYKPPSRINQSLCVRKFQVSLQLSSQLGCIRPSF